ncbi:interferon gamma receptor 2 isoform X2 [Cyprinodon tularosa]|uniref:interferon gamma receptor 2 isoform X2 n=1 Tax=Cyprinodon tularosa TaxID=77115 RepID=UPI0018E21AAB|nr:interferon gamma receptor 2 isoform X2 [Cyprinodon tularosa]
MDGSGLVSPERRFSFGVVWFLVLFCRTAEPAAAVEKSSELQNVRINQTLLTWSSAASDGEFSVEYRGSSFDSKWTPLDRCNQTRLTSCDVSQEQNREEFGCLRVRVAAQRNGEKPVEACSREGHPCSPNVTLSVSPGSLTVLLHRNPPLHAEYANNFKHRITFRKEGEEPEEQVDEFASRDFDDLEAGQRYCVQVQFVLYGENLLGPPSCEQCETIPASDPDPTVSKTTQIVVVSIVVSVIFLLVGFAYIHLFKSRKIKECLQPPYTIPGFFQDLPPVRDPAYLAVNPSEENYDVVSSVIPKQPRGV